MRDRVEVSATEEALRIQGDFYPLLSPEVVSSDGLIAVCACVSDDAGKAYAALPRGEVLARLAHDDHFRVALRRCNACGQRFLSVFTELIDWNDGDDSQATV